MTAELITAWTRFKNKKKKFAIEIDFVANN